MTAKEIIIDLFKRHNNQPFTMSELVYLINERYDQAASDAVKEQIRRLIDENIIEEVNVTAFRLKNK